MARKKSNLINDLAELPWWVGFSLAAIVYVVMKWLLPSVEWSSPYITGFVSAAAPTLAPVVALVCVFGGFLSLVESWKRKSLFKTQSNKLDLDSLSWTDFEKLIGEYLKHQGYSIYAPAKAGADGGVDIRVTKEGRKGLVQCKHWKSRKVGVAVIREMFGLMTAESADFVLLAISGEFTAEAKKFAQGKPISLLNHSSLKNGIKSVIAPQTLIVPVDEPPAQRETSCPKCGSELVLRTAKKGANIGNEFYGCSSFPKCRHIQNV